MKIQIISFSFQSFKDGGFFKIKGKYENPLNRDGPPEDINLRMYAKTSAEALEAFTKITTCKRNHRELDVYITSKAKQSDWEKERKQPVFYNFRFHHLVPYPLRHIYHDQYMDESTSESSSESTSESTSESLSDSA